MKKLASGFVILLLLALMLAGCGGGGNNGAGSRSVQAVAKLAAVGIQQNISAISLTITLPEGVYARTRDGVHLAEGVVTFPGATNPGNILNASRYTPLPGKSSGGTLNIDLISLDYSGGVFATLQCDILPGFIPVANDFAVTMNGAWNSQGANITQGLQCAIDPQIL